MKKRKKRVETSEYEVTIKATVVVSVRSVNAYRAIGRAEDLLQEQLAGSAVDLVDLKTTMSKSI